MPAIAEKEVDEKKKAIIVPSKFKQLERDRNHLAEGIAFEESQPDNILFNAPVWTLSAKDVLLLKLKNMRKTIEEYKEFMAEIRQTVAYGETAEIKEGMKAVEPGIKEFAEAQVEETFETLKNIAGEITAYLKDYELVASQYFVRLGGRYFALLTEIKRASQMLGNAEQKKIDALQAEYAEYYHSHDRIKLAILGDAMRPGWLADLQKKRRNAKKIENYEAFTNSVELFILTNKKQMELLGEHIKRQVEIRFKESIKLADELLKSASILEHSL